ncbi:hypothetical protein FMA36_13720 [Komagataeibacter xylinus]|uniref:Uncharacterized protein n=2 Tax=Komagataeibacter xylinus TaxID=28448 RepID=A0A857FS58_KOMXY|nr:hypothetical protein [Komagataeibacter xylinus]QHC37231.1 hypothetical protein FMA36_13720 [Komagataeibacter xylinus]
MAAPGLLADLKARIIAPALAFIGLGGPAAVNLFAGIALAETGYRALVRGGGPALGLSAIRARLKCYRAPDADDAVGQYRFWKTHYNTALEAGDVELQHVALFAQAIEA